MKFLQFFLALTILITIHELGHFYFARKFKARVDKFYLFFDFLFPFAGLLNFSVFKKKIGETEYGLGWFPLGGYVQIAGMVDEQMDKSQIDTPPQPWELRAKPAWQRLLVMLGGILFNLILGFFIYIMVLFVWGKDTLPVDKLQHGVVVDSTAYYIGLRNGDKLLSINHEKITSLNRVAVMIIMNKAKSIEVNRDGRELSFPISDNDISLILKRLRKSAFVSPRLLIIIDSVLKGTVASKIGLLKGDQIIKVNMDTVLYQEKLRPALLKLKNQEVTFTVKRNDQELALKGKLDSTAMLGITQNRKLFYPIETKQYSFFESIVQGFKDGIENIVMQAKQIVVLITVKDAYQQVSGFYSIYESMPEQWNWEHFWTFTGMLSLVLAFMNFLPIPMLDGGYILFILIEMVTRRKVSEKIIYYANNVGLVILLILMVYANTDFLRLK